MALILTVNSHHPTLLGLITDSLHLTLWMLFSIHGITQGLWLAACSLLSDYAFYLKLFFPSTNQAFHQVACLFAFEAFNLTCQCQPEASSWSHILKCLWLNLLIILRTVGTHRYQLLHAMQYILNCTPAIDSFSSILLK